MEGNLRAAGYYCVVELTLTNSYVHVYCILILKYKYTFQSRDIQGHMYGDTAVLHGDGDEDGWIISALLNCPQIMW